MQHRLRVLSIGLAAAVLLTSCELVPSLEFQGSLEAAPELLEGNVDVVDDLSISIDADCDNAVDVGRAPGGGLGGDIFVPVIPDGDVDAALPGVPDAVNEFLDQLPEGTSVTPAEGSIVADDKTYEVLASVCDVDPDRVRGEGISSATVFFATDAAAEEIAVGFVAEVIDDNGDPERIFILVGTEEGLEGEEVLAGRLIEDPPPVVDRFVGEGVYRLENVDLDRWLASDGDENRSNVVTNLDDSERSLWEFIDNGDGTWLVRNVATGGYLDGDGANRDWNVDQSIAPSSDDRWIVTDVGNNEWSLRNAARNRLLDADRDHQDWNVDLSRALRGDRKWEFTLVD